MKDLRGWYAILSNCEREAWKKFRLQRDSNPWPLRYRCSALPTELWSHNCWEQVNFSGSIMPLRVIQHYSDWVCTAVMSNDVMKDLRVSLKLTCSQQLWLHSSVGRALHGYRRGHGFESRWSLNFFQASLSQLLKIAYQPRRSFITSLLITSLLITAVQTQSLCCITLSGMMDPLKLTCSQQLWLHSSVGRALHRYRRGHGFESRWSLNFFQASLSQLLKIAYQPRRSFITLLVFIPAK